MGGAFRAACTSYAILVDDLEMIEKHADKNTFDTSIHDFFFRCAGSILKVLFASEGRNRSDKTSEL